MGSPSESSAQSIYNWYRAAAPTAVQFTTHFNFSNNRNKIESYFLAEVIDSAIEIHGVSTALDFPYMDVLLRRFVALRVADKHGNWEVANGVIECKHDVIAPEEIMDRAMRKASKKKKSQQWQTNIGNYNNNNKNYRQQQQPRHDPQRDEPRPPLDPKVE